MAELRLAAGDGGDEPLAWRLRRLADFAERVLQRLPSGIYPFEELVDVEGELTVVWKSQSEQAIHSTLVEQEWAELDADPANGGHAVTHELSGT